MPNIGRRLAEQIVAVARMTIDAFSVTLAVMILKKLKA